MTCPNCGHDLGNITPMTEAMKRARAENGKKGGRPKGAGDKTPRTRRRKTEST